MNLTELVNLLQEAEETYGGDAEVSFDAMIGGRTRTLYLHHDDGEYDEFYTLSFSDEG